MNPREVTSIDKEIGLRSRTMRIDRGLSQSHVAELLGVSFQQIQKYEKGTNRMSLARAIQICRVLEADIGELAGTGHRRLASTTFNRVAYELACEFETLPPNVAKRLIDLIEQIIKTTSRSPKKKK
jgi:transcriptional regulator with XRE-family HTH domain